MKPKIKRTKQPDGYSLLEYFGKTLAVCNELHDRDYLIVSPNDFSDEFYLSLPEAKELSKVLPKFLEEMEKTK